MKILILTYGSRGDVQPYVALGKGLKQAGHDVTLATSVRFRDFVSEHGLHYGYMSDELLAILDTEQGREMLENTRTVFQVLKRMLSMLKQVGPMQRSLLQDSWAVAEASAPDCVIFHPKAYGGQLIAEKYAVPAILALPVALMVPTGERPAMGFPDMKLGAWYNRLTYRIVNSLMNLSAAKTVKASRAAQGMPPRRRFDILHTATGADMPVLHAISRHVLPQPADWPPTARMSGYWFLDQGDDWTPPAALEAFLQAGPPPVYVGFGSMAGRDPERLTDIVVQALQQAGKRGIIATGWGGLNAGHLPDSILRIEQAPHDRLFPRMAAVVHHGGAGTTAAALRAGRPSVIVPFFGDQPYWGKQVYALGAGSRPIAQKKLTVDELARAISEVTGDVDMIDKAQTLGRLIRSENGIGEAVAFIEACVATSERDRDDRMYE